MTYLASIHPLGFVHSLMDKYGDELTLSFSKYYYRPNSVFDERETFEAPIFDVTTDWLESHVGGLRSNWELAMNSLVRDRRGRSLHVGMIDFIGQPSVSLVRSRVHEMIATKEAKDLVLYDSGRSLHGYLLTLMPPAKWREFLGRLLLMNFVDEDPLVDSRWVGHRLIGGFSALRWSSNSSVHASDPRILDQKF
jgi:hypothetical protein